MWNSPSTSAQEEEKFLPGDDEQGQQQQHSSCCHQESKTSTRYILAVAISSILVILLALDVALRWQSFSACSCSDSVEIPVLQANRSEHFVGNGYASEFPPLRDVITYSLQNYTGAFVRSNVTGKLSKTSGPVEYFGHPSPELDEVWHNFLRNQFPILYDHEIDPHYMVVERDRLPFDKKFHFEPDVSHSLHCLSAVRKHVNFALYPDVQPTAEEIAMEQQNNELLADNWKIMHVEHCMDRIRQSLMCHADLTPSPVHVFPGLPVAITRTGQRTCRDWAPIRKWIDERWEEGMETARKEEAEKIKQAEVEKEEHLKEEASRAQ